MPDVENSPAGRSSRRALIVLLLAGSILVAAVTFGVVSSQQETTLVAPIGGNEPTAEPSQSHKGKNRRSNPTLITSPDAGDEPGRASANGGEGDSSSSTSTSSSNSDNNLSSPLPAEVDKEARRNWPKGEVMPTAEVYKYYQNTLVLMMMSPPRYHLVQLVQRHYAPFFRHMFFCGPRNNSDYGIPIHGYDIVYGNEQYRAVNVILRDYMKNETLLARHSPDSPAAKPEDVLHGALYIADDIIFQPWSIAAKNFSFSIPWAVQMGIGHAKNPRPVGAVPMMAVEGRFRRQWPYWRKNQPKLLGALKEGGPAFRKRLAAAAAATNGHIYRWSKYSRTYVGGNLSNPEAQSWSVFFTIVDTYYVPRSMWVAYCAAADLMAKHWVFGECAIATMLRSLHPTYEEMNVQFYWADATADNCVRHRWSIDVDGFHRCRHDHVFPETILFTNDTMRRQLARDTKLIAASKRIGGLVSVPYPPFKFT